MESCRKAASHHLPAISNAYSYADHSSECTISAVCSLTETVSQLVTGHLPATFQHKRLTVALAEASHWVTFQRVRPDGGDRDVGQLAQWTFIVDDG